MIKALDQAGLRALAPSVVGDYFPDKSPKELARKAEVCEGAEPQQHSHYFTAEGEFGSLDQNGEPVDQQRYRVIDSRKLRIDTEFGPEDRYRTAGGDRLTLEPLIPNRAKRAARGEAARVRPGRAHGRSCLYRPHMEARRLRMVVLAGCRTEAEAAAPSSLGRAVAMDDWR